LATFFKNLLNNIGFAPKIAFNVVEQEKISAQNVTKIMDILLKMEIVLKNVMIKAIV